MKFEIFKLESVTSTNDVAISLIKKDKKNFGCVSANIQTKGRGTHGKEWISEKGNFFGSIFFPLKKNYPSFSEFSIISPIIVSEAIKHFCEKCSIKLKFPNDIFANGKKICGILQEVIVSGNQNFLITGIGLNIVSNPEIHDKYQATNILSQTKKIPKIEKIIDLIIASYLKFFTNLDSYNYMDFKKKADLMSLN
tara:strand:+ start:406 stop:990 length:585 start_codon:yes stop_codon:yes gene_type:complete